MKKSRIIIPAIAVMALSMGAAVTSTVAWFTANRNASATSGSITLINPEGGLTVAGEPGSGTTVKSTAEDGKSVTLQHYGNLRDASVDLITSKGNATVYRPILNDDNTVSAYKAVPSVGGGEGENGGYKQGTRFSAYSYTLKLTFGDSNSTPGFYGLFFDGAASNSINVTGSDTAGIANSIRVGLVSDTTVYVFAPSSSVKLNTTYKYTNSVSSQKQYAAGDLADEARTQAYNSDEAKNLLQTKQLTSSAVTFNCTVYTWLEGDTVTGNTAIPSGMELNLTFHVLKASHK